MSGPKALVWVAISLAVIGAGVYGLVTEQFTAGKGRVVIVTGRGAAIMAASFIFIGLGMLRGTWQLYRTGTVDDGDPLLILLACLVLLGLGGGFIVFIGTF